jgi:hypothetical protein
VSFAAIGLVLAGLCFVSGAHAALITVDENGNGIGTIANGSLRLDPGPGGLPSVLTYNLPFTATQGDIALSSIEPGFRFPIVFDYIRFNGNGTLDFYSDNVPVFDSLADTSGPPLRFYANLITISEVGPEGNNRSRDSPVSIRAGRLTILLATALRLLFRSQRRSQFSAQAFSELRSMRTGGGEYKEKPKPSLMPTCGVFMTPPGGAGRSAKR